jgi:DNA repair protein RadC
MKEPNTRHAPLYIRDETGKYRPATHTEISRTAAAQLLQAFKRGPNLTAPNHVREYLRLQLTHLEREAFAIVFLDNRHRVIDYDELFYGTVDGASVHVREVVKAALQANAAAVILAHNHPSGVAEPSKSDKLITAKIRDALSIVDIRVLDHMIVGDGPPVSMAERGLI